MNVQYVPDLAREAAFELINERWFLQEEEQVETLGGEYVRTIQNGGRQAFAFYQLPADYLDVGTDKASVALYTTGGNRGDWERTDRLTVELYAPGTAAVEILEAITDLLVNDGGDHDLQAGYVDEIRCDITPHDVPFPGGDVNQARAGFLVTHRPQ